MGSILIGGAVFAGITATKGWLARGRTLAPAIKLQASGSVACRGECEVGMLRAVCEPELLRLKSTDRTCRLRRSPGADHAASVRMQVA